MVPCPGAEQCLGGASREPPGCDPSRNLPKCCSVPLKCIFKAKEAGSCRQPGKQGAKNWNGEFCFFKCHVFLSSFLHSGLAKLRRLK